MKLHTLRVANFRCFGEGGQEGWGLIFKPKEDLNLIIGPNGSGKTALLDALDVTMNPQGRTNEALISEYDFPGCDTTKHIKIEVVLTDLGMALLNFESDVQWIDPSDGVPVEMKQVEVDESHQRAVIIRFEAKSSDVTGELEWNWYLPKFPATEGEDTKELSSKQHWSIGYFHIQAATSAGAFTFNQYSSLGRHLRKLEYRLGKLPKKLTGTTHLPECLFENPSCDTCSDRLTCLPAPENPESAKDGSTVGLILHGVAADAKRILGEAWGSQLNPSLGPRYGGQKSRLAALTMGLLTNANTSNPGFLPFERLSSGERYAFSFALAKIRVPGDQPPVIVMEEPETALHGAAVALLLADFTSIPTGNVPQVFISSHSESVLRYFPAKNVFVMGRNREPANLDSAIAGVSSEKEFARRMEYLIMPGGPSCLFSAKILLVEGAQEAIVSGYLDRMSALLKAKKREATLNSFASLGWTILDATGAGDVPKYVRFLQSLGKRVVALFDGDDSGKRGAEGMKELCPTYYYKSRKTHDPRLEEALLEGLSERGRVAATNDFYAYNECSNCAKRDAADCWVQRGECGVVGDKADRKRRIQALCLVQYEKEDTFPPAFKQLLTKIEASSPGLYELPIEE